MKDDKIFIRVKLFGIEVKYDRIREIALKEASMAKVRKRNKIIEVLVLSLMAICIGLFIYRQKDQAVNVLDVYVQNQDHSAAFTYGMNTNYPWNEKWRFGSTVFGQEDKDVNLEGLQVMYTVSDTVSQDIDEIIRQNPDQEVWISLILEEEIPKKELENFYDYIEQKVAPYENIEIAYPIEAALKLYKTREIDWINHSIKTPQDIDRIEVLPIDLKENVQIIINDYLVEGTGMELTNQLDTISRLYYNIAIKMPEVKFVFNQYNLNNAHYRVVELYNQILSEKWISYERVTKYNEIYHQLNQDMPIALSVEESKENENIQLITSYRSDIEYIEYKLNEQSVKKVYRYPFKLEKDDYEVYNEINKLKVIIKLKNEEKPVVQEYYIDFNQVYEVGDRAQRATKTYELKENMQYEKPYIPVLMYHEFKDIVGESESEQSISVSTQLFEEQIQMLLQEDYTPITFKELEQYFEQKGGLPAKPVIITTDDGYLSNYTIAYPILKKYNIPATYFITSAYVGVQTTMPHFTWDEAREMEASGLIDIQSHTHAHALLDKLKEGEVLYQASMSFAAIEKELGERDVKVLAYPQFQHNKKTIKWLESVGVDLQVTNLVKRKGITKPLDIKRIHVANMTTPEDLIEEIKRLTMN